VGVVIYEVNDISGVLDYVSHRLAVALMPASGYDANATG
jgi:hypothetical protein